MKAGWGRYALSVAAVTGALWSADRVLSGQAAQSTPGLVEHALSTVVRPSPTSAELSTFLPGSRAAFRFPAPYNTEGFRFTVPNDCGGRDCVSPVGYAYWRNINHHVGFEKLYVFLALNRESGGEGPTLFSLDKASGLVEKVGPLFPANDARSWSSGEGWYFSGSASSVLYLHTGTDPRLARYDIWSRTSTTVFDLSNTNGTVRLERLHLAAALLGRRQGTLVHRQAERCRELPDDRLRRLPGGVQQLPLLSPRVGIGWRLRRVPD